MRRKYDQRKAGAMINVLSRILERDGSMPSPEVQAKAMAMLERKDRSPIKHHVGNWQRYTVDGAGGRYTVVAQIWPEESHDHPQRKVLDADCSCPAATTCKHLLVVLAQLELDGYHLDT